MRAELAIGVHRTRSAGADLHLSTTHGAYVLPHAVPATAKRRIDERKLPQPIEFEAVSVKSSIVDLRILLHGHTAALVFSVTDRDL